MKQPVFQSDCLTLHSHQQYLRVPYPPHLHQHLWLSTLFIVAIPVCVKGYLLSLLICVPQWLRNALFFRPGWWLHVDVYRDNSSKCTRRIGAFFWTLYFNKKVYVKSTYSTSNKELHSRTSGQDGGVGIHTVPPRTTKRRTTTNLKTKINQNWQKIELYGCPTTKELKKKHSPRLVGGVETDSQAERTHSKAAAGGPGQARWWLADRAVPHPRADKPGGTTGERDIPCKPGFQQGK